MSKDTAQHMETSPRRVSVTSHKSGDAARHGDRALRVIGDERVTVTEEDVSDRGCPTGLSSPSA